MRHVLHTDLTLNLRSVDLNLLVVLQALLDEQHVSRAARRLSLSQPATSNALERCRIVFGDPLLHRVAGEMRLTDKAEALKSPLNEALSSVAEIFGCTPANGVMRQTIRLAMADQPGTTILVSIVRRIGDTNPNLDLILLPWRSKDDALNRLENGEVDIAVSDFGLLAPEYCQAKLRADPYVVAMRRSHPAADGFNLERWLAWPHIVVSGKGSKRGSLEDILAKLKLRRRVGAVVPNFKMIEPLLLQTDFISFAPRSALSGFDLAVLEPPLIVPNYEMHMAWHTRRNGDATLQAIIGIISASFGDPVAA